MRKHFMDCVEVVCLRTGRGVFFLQVICVWGWGFQSLWIAKGGEMGFVGSGFAGDFFGGFWDILGFFLFRFVVRFSLRCVA